MRPYTLAALLSTLPCAAHALDLPPVQYPTLPAQAATAAGFVPNGWTLESARPRMTATRAFSPWRGHGQPAMCWRCRTIS